ncbi:ABC transporter permease, partial [Nocardioides sp. SOB77]|nr:ABC transporter permease [Nocardioides oceani]
ITALVMIDHGWTWWAAALAGIAIGALIGLAIGSLVTLLGIPSFVVTLAFFLALQAVPLKLIGSGGSLRFDNEVLRGLSIKNVPVTAGWIAAVLIVIGFAAVQLFQYRTRATRGLVHKPLALVLVQ